MVEFDEALKGAPDTARSQAHFSMLEGDPEFAKFNHRLQEDFYCIEEAVKQKDTRQKLLDFLSSSEFQVQIPTWNEEDTVGAIVEYLVQQLGSPNKIIAMDADSTDNSAAVIKKHGVRVIRQSDMYECIKREEFLKILNDDRPRGRGMTLFAFWIYRFLIQEGGCPRYISYVDSDIKNFAQYDPLPFLAYPIVMNKGKNFSYIKTAKPGRNNETVMGARCALRAINDLGGKYFERLSKDMWILTGEYIVETKYMKKLPHTTRSFVDTLTAMYFADLEEQQATNVVMVSNPNPRLDKKNDAMKEQTILYSIATNAVAFVMFGKPASELTIDDIKRLNKEVFNKYTMYPYIPEEPGRPMQAANVVNDRFIPSIDQLIQHDLIDWNAVKKMKRKYLASSI